MRDPYEVLGVSKSTSHADIKKAYRHLAKKFHPDHNKNDPKAATRFSEINSAYEIVGDEEKKGKFDRGEIGADGKPRFAGFEGIVVAAGTEGALLKNLPAVARHQLVRLYIADQIEVVLCRL